jgi:dipeptidyl aminopeptidase/acylaminoacyl peptidase
MRPRHMVMLLVLGTSGAQVLAWTQQAPPAAAAQNRQPEIFLVPFSDASQSRVGAPVVNITNNPGYDNQPQFLPDSRGLLFSSNRDGKQNDIYRYDIASKAVVQVTRTPENEYSPTVTPDGKAFTTVRGSEQRLWRFNMDGSDAGLAYAHTGLIGYHAWVSPTTLATFILGTQPAPNTLQLIDLPTGTAQVIESSIGRSLLIRPRLGTVSFVHKPQGGSWTIKELDAATRAIRTIGPTVEGSEDLAWTPDGVIVMGARSKLFTWEAATNRWIEEADLANAGVENITRLTVSPDGRWIAIVAQAVVK